MYKDTNSAYADQKLDYNDDHELEKAWDPNVGIVSLDNKWRLFYAFMSCFMVSNANYTYVLEKKW